MLFLFKKNTDGITGVKKSLYWAWNIAAVLISSAALGLLLLLYAYGTYERTVFWSYFDNFHIIILNIIPIVLLVMLMYLLTGRSWIAFLSVSVLTFAMSLGNMYKIKFRDDPFSTEDIKDITAGLRITGEKGYDITPTARVWFGVGCIVLCTLALFFLARGRLRARVRLPIAAAPLIAAVCLLPVYKSSDIYNVTTKTTCPDIRVLSESQNYLSKGFIYPFIHSIWASEQAQPTGFSEQDIKELFGEYTSEEIPEDKKINFIYIMREAYNDLSKYENVTGVDWSAYDAYHALKEQSYTGALFTNIFAGGTVDTERSAMTGFSSLPWFRQKTNSYMYYFQSQGYTVEGSHPGYNDFYNRTNVNEYLGFTNYYFSEDYYDALKDAEDTIAFDRELYSGMISLWENRDKSKPYLSFNVTYEGHGPYKVDGLEWPNEYVSGDYSDYTKNVLNNYLGLVADSNAELIRLIDYYREQEEPVVICSFGDHNPWLGDGNSVYEELGMNIDLADETGIKNYYETEYLIWANDAAKEITGFDFVGRGPEVSSCYLMNVVMQNCSLKGPAYMQMMSEFMETMPIVSSKRFYQINGEFCTEIPESYRTDYERFEALQYYIKNNFIY